MAHDKIHIPVIVSVQNRAPDSPLVGCKVKEGDCGSWATGVSEITLFSYNNTGEVLFNQTTIVSAIGCIACQFGRNVHPLEHEEIGSSDKGSNWTLDVYDRLADAREDAISAARPAAEYFVADTTQQAIARKDSKR